MKTIQLSFLVSAILCLARPAFSQGVSNTDNTITLTGTCLSLPSGSYNFSITYGAPDGSGTPSIPPSGTIAVTVVNNGSSITITAPSGTGFPTVASTGLYSLADVIYGTIQLTGGPGGANAYFHWDQNPSTGGIVGIGDCGTVPIYIDHFTGSLSGSTVHLSWNTELEQNTTYIEIYRSTSGSGYYKIGQVAAAGNSSGTRPYSYTDNNPGPSNTYYLKMLNSQGTTAKFSNTIAVSCPGCTYTPPTPVNCSFTINGPDHICSQGTVTPYSLSNAVPNYSTITWSVDKPSSVSVLTYPAFDRTQVSLLRKSTDANITLTATLSGCSNVISKLIAIGTPAPDIYADQACPEVMCQPSGIPNATSYLWMLDNASTATQTYATVVEFDAYIGDGSIYDVSLSYTNACGTSPWNTVGNFWCEPGTSQSARRGTTTTLNPGGLNLTPGAVAWPNPTHGALSVMLPPPNTPGAPATPSKIYQVKVLDAQGIVHKTYSYPAGIDKASVDISGLASGVYILQIFDNQRWVARQVVLTK